MFEVKFTGATFLEVRKEIQEFAINHLNAKFDTGYNTGPVAATSAHVTTVDRGGVSFGTAENLTVHRPVPEPKAPMHVMTENAAIAPEKRKPGRQPGFSPKKKAEEAAQLAFDMEAEATPAKVQKPIPSEDEAMAAIQAVQEKHGMDKAKRIILDEILPTFGVKRGRDLKPEQRAQFIEACEQA